MRILSYQRRTQGMAGDRLYRWAVAEALLSRTAVLVLADLNRRRAKLRRAELRPSCAIFSPDSLEKRHQMVAGNQSLGECRFICEEAPKLRPRI